MIYKMKKYVSVVTTLPSFKKVDFALLFVLFSEHSLENLYAQLLWNVAIFNDYIFLIITKQLRKFVMRSQKLGHQVIKLSQETRLVYTYEVKDCDKIFPKL